MQFYKMHGLGNDFIIIQEQVDDARDYSVLAQKLCHRNTGIGADGLLVVLPSRQADIKMRIINNDGSEANMCGNGIRCFARFVWEQKILTKHEFAVETKAGVIYPHLTVLNDKVTEIRVNMGKPFLKRSQIPMIGPDEAVIAETITEEGEKYTITSLLMGVPHTIIFVDKISNQEVLALGPKIEKHRLFPEHTNVNFVEILNDSEIRVRTWERGAGMTLACGTGCCASVVAAVLNKRTKPEVTVHLGLGDLKIEYAQDGFVYMSGPASYICSGEVELDF